MEPSNPRSTDSNVEQLSLFAQDVDPSSVRRKSWVWLAILMAIAGSSLMIWRFFMPIEKTQAAIAQPQTSLPPRAVETTTLQLGNAETRIQLLGQVEASQQSTIRAQTGGVVEQVLAQAGDRVEQGATIVVLNDSDQQYAVSEAQARLAQQRSNLARLEVGTRPEIIDQRQAALTSAEARERETQDNLQRTQDLVKQGAVSQRLLVEAQTGVDAARGEQLEARAELAEAKAGPIREEIEAQKANVAAAVAALNQARLSQQRTRVIAPASGIVQMRRVSQGDLVEPNSELITLVDRNQLDVFLEVPENLGSQVRSGMAVELTTRALPNWKQRATITAIAPTADQASRRQQVRVELANPPQGLIPGMAVEATLSQPSNRTGFIVSRDVLTQRQNQWFVFTIADNKAKPIAVEMVADMGTQVAIASRELQPGQTIVSRGGDGLQDGMTVKVVRK